MVNKINSEKHLGQVKTAYLKGKEQFEYQILVCGGAGCVSSNCGEVEKALRAALTEQGLDSKVQVTVTGCMGLCSVGPVLLVEPEGVFYVNMTAEKVADIVQKHLIDNGIVEEYTYFDPTEKIHLHYLKDIPFYKEQVHIALRNCGKMPFSSLEAYIARDGYFAIAKALNMDRKDVVAVLKESGLRGRGGAGFPTGIKWESGMKAPGAEKYLVCNADEGDPGAFMDRSLLEGDPHSIIEGMLIGGYAIGAKKGYIYVRAEYPLAVERMTEAMNQAREAGLLGKGILGSESDFDIELRIGAGAFVCGEETALLASLEGRRGEPSQKPPFPFESGLFTKPTIINNVETLANVAPIIINGAEWYCSFGTEKSKGTKVFALAGNIVNSGIIEVPMGTVLGDIIFKIGGGIIGNKKFKAIQSGGPSGGCLTAEHLNIQVDYESLAKLGAIMGSGGLIVMNEDTCMVDTARYFMDFIKDESCGKCLPCRVGTKRMLEILEKLTEGRGQESDLEMLEEIAATIRQTAMCGLGQTASNPVLSTIKYFREEYETHIHDKHCNAGVCAELYTAPCQNACPASVNVPGYMALVAAGRLMDAYELIRQENPFPAVCGRICTHPCESHCRRAQVDEALAICSIKRFVGDYALRDEFSIPRVEPLAANGKKVAVIGAGPSGLTCAYYLAQLGYDVTVYEREAIAGGVLYWGIPKFRLPKEVVSKEINAIKAAGVKIRTNTYVGRDIDFNDLYEENDAVYIAIGTQKSKILGIPGDNFAGSESGLAFLRRIGLKNDTSVPDRLVVVGGGSTAMDVARTAIRLGTNKVTVIYRRSLNEMPASPQEVVEAQEEGIEITTLVSPLEIFGDDQGHVAGIKCVRTVLGEFGRDGRRKTNAVPDSDFIIECDGVVAAVNQEIDNEYTIIRSDTINGSYDINKFTSETSQEGVFAGGDISSWGANTVISAIADGKRAARSIDKYLGGDGVLNKGRDIEIPNIYDDEVVEHKRFPVKTLSPEERYGNFKEVECGFHKLDAMGEALRCLRCDRR